MSSLLTVVSSELHSSDSTSCASAYYVVSTWSKGSWSLSVNERTNTAKSVNECVLELRVFGFFKASAKWAWSVSHAPPSAVSSLRLSKYEELRRVTFDPQVTEQSAVDTIRRVKKLKVSPWLVTEVWWGGAVVHSVCGLRLQVGPSSGEQLPLCGGADGYEERCGSSEGRALLSRQPGPRGPVDQGGPPYCLSLQYQSCSYLR